jgi:hypothetical protein
MLLICLTVRVIWASKALIYWQMASTIFQISNPSTLGIIRDFFAILPVVKCSYNFKVFVLLCLMTLHRILSAFGSENDGSPCAFFILQCKCYGARGRPPFRRRPELHSRPHLVEYQVLFYISLLAET